MGIPGEVSGRVPFRAWFSMLDMLPRKELRVGSLAGQMPITERQTFQCISGPKWITVFKVLLKRNYFLLGLGAFLGNFMRGTALRRL
jgi:hypothetical protein